MNKKATPILTRKHNCHRNTTEKTKAPALAGAFVRLMVIVRAGRQHHRMAIDSNGDLMMRRGDNMAMDMDTGDIHLVSSWPDDDDDD